MESRTRFSVSHALFASGWLVFFFTLLNGYALNLVGGYQADARLVFAGLVVEALVTLAAARRWVQIDFDALELAGFLVVVFGVCAYFIAAAWPTLLPPTPSVDAVRHYLNVLFSYPRGTLVSWYPAGGAFVAAMFSHWLGVAPLWVLHPLAASFIALSAGAVYGMTCALLPPGRLYKIVALVAPALLFVPWSYFVGIVDGEQYFYAQAFAQLFVIAAWWCLFNYAAERRWLWLALFGAALLGTVAAYPYLVALPFGLCVLVLVARERARLLRDRGGLAVLAVFAALLLLAAVALQHGGVLELRTVQVTATSDVGEGGVTNPSLGSLGGPVFLLLALVGLFLAWRSGARGRTLLGLLVVWLAQFVALGVLQPLLQISGYRVDKTFYILVFPLAILAALPLARLVDLVQARVVLYLFKGTGPPPPASAWAWAAALPVTVAILVAAIVMARPPVFYSPLDASELQVALWAQEHLDTYQLHDLPPGMTRAYWLAFGLWREVLPNEWFQWIPAGVKLGPPTFDEWKNDPAWGQWLLVPDMKEVPDLTGLAVVYRVGDAAILQKTMAPLTPPAPAQPVNLYFGDRCLKLLGYDLPRAKFTPGEVLTVTTYVESIQPPAATVTWRVELLDTAGQVVSRATGDPFVKYPLQRWPPGRYARDEWALPLDRGLAPGVYHLQMGLYLRTDGEPIDVHPLLDTWAPQERLSAATLGRIKLPVPPPSAAEWGAATRVDAPVGADLLLARYALDFDSATRTVHLTLYWQSRATTGTNYTVFVHALDASGQIIAQKDAPPREGSYPTSVWDMGEVVPDVYTLAIPGDASLPVRLEVGMYDASNDQRLPIGSTDHIVLRFKNTE